jgi:hypothetical protein
VFEWSLGLTILAVQKIFPFKNWTILSGFEMVKTLPLPSIAVWSI